MVRSILRLIVIVVQELFERIEQQIARIQSRGNGRFIEWRVFLRG